MAVLRLAVDDEARADAVAPDDEPSSSLPEGWIADGWKLSTHLAPRKARKLLKRLARDPDNVIAWLATEYRVFSCDDKDPIRNRAVSWGAEAVLELQKRDGGIAPTADWDDTTALHAVVYRHVDLLAQYHQLWRAQAFKRRPSAAEAWANENEDVVLRLARYHAELREDPLPGFRCLRPPWVVRTP